VLASPFPELLGECGPSKTAQERGSTGASAESYAAPWVGLIFGRRPGCDREHAKQGCQLLVQPVGLHDQLDARLEMCSEKGDQSGAQSAAGTGPGQVENLHAHVALDQRTCSSVAPFCGA